MVTVLGDGRWRYLRASGGTGKCSSVLVQMAFDGTQQLEIGFGGFGGFECTASCSSWLSKRACKSCSVGVGRAQGGG